MRPFRDPAQPYPLLQLPVLMGHSRIHCRTRILQALPATPEQGSHLVHINDSLQQLSSKNLSFHEFLFIRLSLSTLLDTPRAVAHPWYLSEMLPLPHLNRWHIFPQQPQPFCVWNPLSLSPQNCHFCFCFVSSAISSISTKSSTSQCKNVAYLIAAYMCLRTLSAIFSHLFGELRTIK